jgi:hypothetical protein
MQKRKQKVTQKDWVHQLKPMHKHNQARCHQDWATNDSRAVLEEGNKRRIMNKHCQMLC